MLGDELFELRDELRVPPEGKVGVDPLFECEEAQLLQAADRRLRERLVGEIAERGAAPEGQRAPQRARRLQWTVRGALGRGPLDRRLELVGVHHRVSRAQDVPAAGEREQLARRARRPIGIESPAQAGDILLHHVGAVLRRLVAPHRVDDLVGRHRPARLEQQHGEHRPLLRRAEVDRSAGAERPHLTEDLEPQRLGRHQTPPGPALFRDRSETAAGSSITAAARRRWCAVFDLSVAASHLHPPGERRRP